jgi:hypothetical protein
MELFLEIPTVKFPRSITYSNKGKATGVPAHRRRHHRHLKFASPQFFISTGTDFLLSHGSSAVLHLPGSTPAPAIPAWSDQSIGLLGGGLAVVVCRLLRHVPQPRQFYMKKRFNLRLLVANVRSHPVLEDTTIRRHDDCLGGT